MGWLRRLLGLRSNNKGSPSIQTTWEKSNEDLEEKQIVEEFQKEQAEIKESGNINGVHYTNYVEHVKQLKREKRHEEAIDILLKLVEAAEAEAKTAKKKGLSPGVAPWYYKHLAIVYRKEQRYEDEVAILERYQRRYAEEAAFHNGGEAKKHIYLPESHNLGQRLAKARELARKNNIN